LTRPLNPLNPLRRLHVWQKKSVLLSSLFRVR